MRIALIAIATAATAISATPLAARDSLGIFSDWGAFRDPETPRCYAIAKAAPSSQQRDYDPFASVGTWPARRIYNQLHLRLSRNIRSTTAITLTIGDRSFALTGTGGNAWAKDQRMDAAIVAAMRSARRMVVRATDQNGRRFSNTYDLNRAATAIDAATVGCAKLGR